MVIFFKLNGGITGSILKQGQIIQMKLTTFVWQLKWEARFIQIFGFGLNLSAKDEQIQKDTYKGRNRTNEIRIDNQILNAKVKYLESNKDSQAIDDFLTLLREICPKPTF